MSRPPSREQETSTNEQRRRHRPPSSSTPLRSACAVRMCARHRRRKRRCRAPHECEARKKILRGRARCVQIACRARECATHRARECLQMATGFFAVHARRFFRRRRNVRSRTQALRVAEQGRLRRAVHCCRHLFGAPEIASSKKPSPRHYWPRAISRAARCARACVFLVMAWRRLGVVAGAVRHAPRRRKRGATQKKITSSAPKIRMMRSMRGALRTSRRKNSRKNSSYQLRIDKVIVYLTTLKLSICESENKFSAQRQKTQSIRDANSHRYAETFDPDIEPPSLN